MHPVLLVVNDPRWPHCTALSCVAEQTRLLQFSRTLQIVCLSSSLLVGVSKPLGPGLVVSGTASFPKPFMHCSLCLPFSCSVCMLSASPNTTPCTKLQWRIKLSDRFELIQRRALCIIEPDLTHEQALASVGLEMLHARGERQPRAFYQKMQDPQHKLHHLLPKARQLTYGLRHNRNYAGQKPETGRAKNTLIHALWDVQLVDLELYSKLLSLLCLIVS